MQLILSDKSLEEKYLQLLSSLTRLEKYQPLNNTLENLKKHKFPERAVIESERKDKKEAEKLIENIQEENDRN